MKDTAATDVAGDPLRLGEFLVGVEGLALLRSGADASAGRAERIEELRDLLDEMGRDPALDESSAGTERTLDDGYRVWSGSYDRPLRLFPIEEPPVHELLRGATVGTVLDAACGTGRHSAPLADAGHDVIGIDRSEPMLRLARRNVPRARFMQADLGSIPLRDSSVDTAVCALALVHVDDLDGPFAEFSRVIRAGGRLVISDVHPTLVALGWQAQFPDGDHGRSFIRLRQHRLSDYVEAGLRNGFAIRRCIEPALTIEAARTPTAGRIPEASARAFAGLPAVVVWEYERV